METPRVAVDWFLRLQLLAEAVVKALILLMDWVVMVDLALVLMAVVEYLLRAAVTNGAERESDLLGAAAVAAGLWAIVLLEYIKEDRA